MCINSKTVKGDQNYEMDYCICGNGNYSYSCRCLAREQIRSKGEVFGHKA